MRQISDRCPACLGSGIEKIPDYDKSGDGCARHKLIPDRWIDVKCTVCHGTGERPDFMFDERLFGAPYDPDFDYVKAQ